MSQPELRWEVILTRQAEKTLYRLAKNLLQRIDQALLLLAANPRSPEAQQLPGHDNLYRLYVDDWRIAYAVEEERLFVLILEIAPKQQPERYQLEEMDEPSPTSQDLASPMTPEAKQYWLTEWIERSSLSEDFYKALIPQIVEDFIYYRTPGAKPYDEPKRIDILRDATQEKIHVLIVDDIAETRENLRKLLYFESDIEVVGVATNGEEAIQMAVEQQPDIVLMDIILPGINGITATEIISQQVPSAQIIIMSVQGDADTFRRAILAGAREFLIKPFSSDELMTSIRRVYQSTALQKLHTNPTASSIRDAFKDLKERIQAKLLAELDPTRNVSRLDEVRRIIQTMFEQILAQENIILSRSERERLFEGIVAEIQLKLAMGEKQATEPQSEVEADLDQSQIRATALWFKFYKLGNSVEISLSVADLSESLSFYQKLGLERVDGGEKPYPWAVVSDGRLHLGLHQQVFSSPTLSYFAVWALSERMVHLQKLGVMLDNIQKFHRIVIMPQNFAAAEFESPEGQRVLLVDLRSDVETTPSGRKFFPKCQSFGELSLKTEDVNATVTCWERLGFERVAEGDQPYPWAIVSDGRIRLGFHQNPKLTQPTITYFVPDMPDRLKRLRRQGIKFVAEHKDRKGRRVGAVIESPDGQLFCLFTGEIKSQTNGQNTEEPQANGSFKVGQKVRIVEGPFADFVGTVDEVDLDRTRVKVQINLFGQEKPVELDFSQVERV